MEVEEFSCELCGDLVCMKTLVNGNFGKLPFTSKVKVVQKGRSCFV